MLTTRKPLAFIAPIVLLLALMLVNCIGCKEKGQNQDTQEQAAVERTEPAVPEVQDEPIDPNGKIKLRILCTTSPNEGRTADFTSFLSRHFIKVETTDYESFREDLAKDFDVVIIDYGATRPGTPVPQLSLSYCRATITFGVAGSMVCRRLDLKPGYL
ncbi:MAG TPA: hypothetical protein VMW24_06465 [Sedimentisphaerales bacterium]|jgi:hypothetical protein|nr:hypothetical protein [Sedimentisphaerales bacterium]